MEPVVVTVVADEMEAEVVCGLLRENGIECAYARDNAAAGAPGITGGFAIAGPTEIFVAEGDLEAAKEILARAESNE
jgi:hypothetical protein